MSRPLTISIVTPSFNQGDTIEDTILSIRDQGYPHFEHLVMDGGSKDATVEVLERHPHLLWVSEPDKGQTDAINKGLARARGEVVAYLNSDDCYRPGAFQAVAAAFQDPNCHVLVGDCDVIDPAGRIKGVYRARLDSRTDLLRWWQWDRSVCIPQPAVFIRRSALDAVGLFDATFDMAMDLEMWMRLAKAFPLTMARATLAAYRNTPVNKTSTRRADMVLDCDRAARKHIDLAPPAGREALLAELDREAAGHLLTIAADLRDRSTLWRAFRFKPAIATSGRFWRTLL